MHLILVDCYDSFTHNIVQAFGILGVRTSVLTCDQATPERVLATRPQAVVLGPGPGRPESSGQLMPLAQALPGQVPTLGICLGHQALVAAYGGRIVRHRPVHGHAPPVYHTQTGLFEGLPQGVPMTRYNSLVAQGLPTPLVRTAWSQDGAIMGFEHPKHPTFGVQFHPESVLSGQAGIALLANFTKRARGWCPAKQPGQQPEYGQTAWPGDRPRR